MQFPKSPILFALALLQTGLLCERRLVSPDCDALGPGPMITYLRVCKQVRLFDSDLTVRFDSVLSDNRCSGARDDCTGLAMIRLVLTAADGHSAMLDMEAWSSPPAWDNGPFHTVDTLGYYITLLELSPRTDGGQLLPYRSYRLRLEIVRKEPDGHAGPVVVPAAIGSEEAIAARYEIDTAYIVGDSLKLTIVHGGGCESHYYVPFLTPRNGQDWIGNDADLFIHHLNNRDYCQALLSRRLVFDLSPLKTLCPVPSDRDRLPRHIKVNVYEYDPADQFDRPTRVAQLEYSY